MTASEPAKPFDAAAFAAERQRMVRWQVESRGVKDQRALAAMRKAPRHLFIPSSRVAEAHDDNPLPIGAGQTISQPYIVALMTELAELAPDSRVLEVGTGSGYQTYMLASLAREVFTMEIHAELQDTARGLLERLGLTNIVFRLASGWGGWPEAAPFDAIVVTAAPAIIPSALKEQLADGGRLVIPFGAEFHQTLAVVRRQGVSFVEKEIIPVRFVPMGEG